MCLQLEYHIIWWTFFSLSLWTGNGLRWWLHYIENRLLQKHQLLYTIIGPNHIRSVSDNGLHWMKPFFSRTQQQITQCSTAQSMYHHHNYTINDCTMYHWLMILRRSDFKSQRVLLNIAFTITVHAQNKSNIHRRRAIFTLRGTQILSSGGQIFLPHLKPFRRGVKRNEYQKDQKIQPKFSFWYTLQSRPGVFFTPKYFIQEGKMNVLFTLPRVFPPRALRTTTLIWANLWHMITEIFLKKAKCVNVKDTDKFITTYIFILTTTTAWRKKRREQFVKENK